MRICVVSLGDPTRDPSVRALVHTLVRTPHEVVVVGSPPSVDLVGVEYHPVAVRVPGGAGLVARLLRRLQPPQLRRTLRSWVVRREAKRVAAELYYPAARRDLEVTAAAADAAGGAVVREPMWPQVGRRDLITEVPGDPALSVSPAGPGLGHHGAGWRPDGDAPLAGRHRGKKIVLVYRRTATSPGRYLEAAFVRAGVSVVPAGVELDWDDVPADTIAVVVVESPYPPARILGKNHRGVPVLFWVHHGEHHLPANLRLAERYQANAVLLAHSWHLAHRFAVPVHRFPFAVAPELVRSDIPFADRLYDVAMVGSGVSATGSRYRRRHRLASDLERRFGERAMFVAGVSPAELARIYATTRVVVNDGGSRHLPITMRVFEAMGSGALLVTDDIPGTDILLDRGAHYLVLRDDPVSQIEGILNDPAAAGIAQNGCDHVWRRHTYDHRVDELMDIVSHARDARVVPPTRGELASGLAAVIDDDVEVQQLAQHGAPDLVDMLPDRAVRSGGGLTPGSIEAVIVGRLPQSGLEAAVLAAKRYVYASGDAVAGVERLVRSAFPDALIAVRDGVLRADLMLDEGYRVSSRAAPGDALP